MEDVLVEIDQELRDEKVDMQLLKSTPANSKSKRRPSMHDEEHKAILNDSNIVVGRENQLEGGKELAQDWTG